jgi:hypothetical protein
MIRDDWKGAVMQRAKSPYVEVVPPWILPLSAVLLGPCLSLLKAPQLPPLCWSGVEHYMTPRKPSYSARKNLRESATLLTRERSLSCRGTPLSVLSEQIMEPEDWGGAGGERNGLLRLRTSLDSKVTGWAAVGACGEVTLAGDGVLGPGPGVTDVDEEHDSARPGEVAHGGCAGDADGVKDCAGLACASCRCTRVAGAYGA